MTREKQIISETKKYYSGDIRCCGAFLHDTEFADNNPDTSSIWHDASEEPKDGIDILFISKKGKAHKVSKIDQTLYEWIKDNDGINKWAYITDLLSYYRKEVNYDKK